MKSITITLLNDRITLPASHNQMIQGIIYQLLSGDPEYSSLLHDKTAGYKLFTFSKFTGKAKHQGREVTYTGNIRFEVRSAYDRTIDIIAAQLNDGAVIMVGSQFLPVLSAEVQQTMIYLDTIIAMMITPVTMHRRLDDGKTYYYRYDDEEFLPLLRQNALRKYESFTDQGMDDDALQIETYAVSDSDKNVSTFKGIYVTGWNGLYLLQAHPHLLEFLYHTGLGDRNSQGYGMFRLYR